MTCAIPSEHEGPWDFSSETSIHRICRIHIGLANNIKKTSTGRLHLLKRVSKTKQVPHCVLVDCRKTVKDALVK